MENKLRNTLVLIQVRRANYLFSQTKETPLLASTFNETIQRILNER